MNSLRIHTGINHLSKHHLIPKSRGGRSTAQNLLKLWRKRHDAWHYLFDNLTLWEIIDHIRLNPEDFITEILSRPSKRRAYNILFHGEDAYQTLATLERVKEFKSRPGISSPVLPKRNGKKKAKKNAHYYSYKYFIRSNNPEIIAQENKTAKLLFSEPLRVRSETITLPMTHHMYSSYKWHTLFNGGIINATGKPWDNVTSGCKATLEGALSIYDVEPGVIKDETYATYYALIESKFQNFLPGIENAFHIASSESLRREALEYKRHILVPFLNAHGDRFIAHLYKPEGSHLTAKVDNFLDIRKWKSAHKYVVVMGYTPLKIFQ